MTDDRVAADRPEDRAVSSSRRPLCRRAAICGVGLLGGSLGLALRERGLAGEVVGVGRDARRLEKAQQAGAVHRFTTDLEEGCRDADLIVLCGPVSIIIEQLPTVMRVAPKDALVTDVGSTKATIVEAAQGLRNSRAVFVGSHPIAGSEKSGAEHARGDLYDGATVILTPTPGTLPSALGRARTLWESVGMQVTKLEPERHDRVLAMLSHLPHLAASVLVALVARSGEAEGIDLLRTVAGPGFADTTRIAMGSVAMWLDIFCDNRKALLDSIDHAIAIFQEARREIESENREVLGAMLEQAAVLRKEMEKR